MTPPPTLTGAERSRAEQLYVTHCVVADSLRGQEGYGVRAISSPETALLEAGQGLPAYELPRSLWAGSPATAQTPRRLALLRSESGAVVLLHTVHAAQDTLGRLRSYFSHGLAYPRLALLEAARTWGSPDWIHDYPAGATKRLSPFYGLPAGGRIDDETLAMFLSDGPAASPDQSLGAVVMPARLADDPKARRNFLRLGLTGVAKLLLTADTRLHVLAEPGLAALLAYAAGRLLPARLTDELTFSTYESLLGGFWGCSHARLVATWTGEGGLDPVALDRHGLGLDSFTGRTAGFSESEILPIIDTLLVMAARRDGPGLAELHSLWERTPDLTAARLGDVLPVRAILGRLRAGKVSRDDLLHLADSGLGKVLLAEFREIVWPIVCELGPTDPAIQRAFRSELEADASRLGAGLVTEVGRIEWREWLSRWQMVRGMVTRERLPVLLSEVLESVREPLDVTWRIGLLREWQNAHDREPPLPLRWGTLLAWEDGAGLANLAAAGLPPAWLGRALWLGLAHSETAQFVIKLVRESEEGRNALNQCRPPHCGLRLEDIGRLLSPPAATVAPVDTAPTSPLSWLSPTWLGIGLCASGVIGFLVGRLLGGR